ncbi:potassium channel family protein [Steroidobacter sp. S1-65]|uniref:Potassium channel family protein n=1 Tax=Steroidobacter gossypii TaxID=2805490 RepID=A0ABS1WUY4_9GAMM|nr:potassium channel family protein [Steroidobacter gossypii]MBM0104774.1 potassium channel family protein [Steroidobacter gossypii]
MSMPEQPIHGASEALNRRARLPGRRLFIGGELSVRRTLLLRAALVVFLFVLVIGVFWLDRDGLRDNHDGEISFIDVVYFTMVSVTTVGYGDIVPVTPQARLVDAIFVTPIRLFVWLIFVGTAYQFVLQHLIEDIRMRRLQARLQGHVVVCGYGHSGRCAAAELAARGIDKQHILIVDLDNARLEDAAEHGYIGILGDASREETLRQTMLPQARALIVCTDRDDTNVLITLTARNIAPDVRIVARVEEAENDKLVRQSGANSTVLPSRVGGILMADSIESNHLATYVMDLISAGGQVTLIERAPREDEVGRHPAEIHSRILRVVRGHHTFNFWDADLRIEPDDKLIVIRPPQAAASA